LRNNKNFKFVQSFTLSLYNRAAHHSYLVNHAEIFEFPNIMPIRYY